MSKKVLFTVLVLVGLVFFGMAGRALADAEQAEAYQKDGQYEQAEAVYKAIVTDYPGSDYALEAQEKLVKLYIWLQRDDEVQPALDKLVTDFSGNSGLPTALYGIARGYDRTGRYEKAKSIYQQIGQYNPNSSCAEKVQLGISRINGVTSARAGEDSAVQAEIDSLLANLSKHPDLPQVLYDIAKRGYEWTGRYEKAKDIYQMITEQYPDAYCANRAQLNIPKGQILSYIDAGDDDKALAAVDKLIAEFPEHSYLASAVSRIAEQYCRKASQLESEGLAEQARDKLQKAIVVCKKVMNELPESSAVPKTCCYAGECYRKLGQYAKSIECYQKVVDDYPEYRMVWNALFLIGRNYESLEKTGAISKSEAEPKIRAAYKQLLETYPDCKATRAAQSWLSRHNSK